jgi:hypothetical protein
VELYARVRRAVVVDKMSEREAAKQFGLARDTVRKMLRYSVPPGYRRQQAVRRPKLDRWTGAIDQILEDDKAEGRKQRHTAKRIFERLRDEHGYTGGYPVLTTTTSPGDNADFFSRLWNASLINLRLVSSNRNGRMFCDRKKGMPSSTYSSAIGPT